MTKNTRNRDLRGKVPESWLCVDCGINTAPGLLNRAEMEKALRTATAIGKLAGNDDPGVKQHITHQSEIYTVRDTVWETAGMEPMGGCLCVGCLESRLGRRLEPKDFRRSHPFNSGRMPATPRLRERRGQQ